MTNVSNTQDSRLTMWHWGCLILLIGGIGTLLVVTGQLLTRQPPLPEGPLPNAEIWTVTPTPLPTATPHPTAGGQPSTVSGDFIVGTRVRVVGTGEAGLNLRSAAGLSAERVDIAVEGTNFIVAGGPAEADGLTWWLLKDETNPQREGWAAENYLQVE